MTTTTIDVEDVCTNAHLVSEIGDATLLDRLLPVESKDSAPFRQRALEETMKSLRRRVPPITEAMLSNVVELRDAVRFGALARLYERAMTQGGRDNVHATKARWYQERFQDELRALQPTIGDEVRSPPRTMTIHRR